MLELRALGAPLVLVCLALAGCGASDDSPRSRLVGDFASQANAPVELDAESGRMFVPAGSEARMLVDLPAGSRFVADRIRWSGSGDARPKIIVRSDGREPEALDLRGASEDEATLAFPPELEGVVEISLSAPGGSTEGGLVAWNPRIVANPRQEVDESCRVEQVPPGAIRPNVIIYLVDTLRKDRLGVYGYGRSLSPELDGFATTATVFDRAYAHSSWTRPSVASIFTGVEPNVHGVNDRGDSLPDDVETLAEILGAEGYSTRAFITNGNVGSEFNFQQGFDVFSRSQKLQFHSDVLNDRVFSDLEESPPDHPVFLYVHAVDPHGPYWPFEPFRQMFAPQVEDLEVGSNEFLNRYRWRGGVDGDPPPRVVQDANDLYDAEIAQNDHHFGAFLEGLKSRGLFDNSLIIFTADHGEEFWEHGDWSHGQSLYSELIDVPLLIKRPFQNTSYRSGEVAQHIDLFATALSAAGLAQEDTDRSGRIDSARAIPMRGLCEAPRYGVFSTIEIDGRKADSVLYQGWKLVVPYTGNLGSQQLFDLADDPLEKRNVYAEYPIRVRFLRRLLEHHLARTGLVAPQARSLSEDLQRQLKALGYLN